MRETMQDPAIVQRLNASLLEPVVETTEETKAFIAAEVPKHVRRCCEEGGVRGAVVIPPAAPRARGSTAMNASLPSASGSIACRG